MTDQRIIAFVYEFNDLIRSAKNEEEVRIGFVAAAINVLGIRDLKMERNRQDVRRNKVIIEFKNKGLFNGTKNSGKFQEALDQLCQTYIPKQAKEDGCPESDYIGVCFDGKHFSFVFKERNDRIRVTALSPFNVKSAATLVIALEKDTRQELTPNNVIDDFGPNSSVAEYLIKALWTQLSYDLDNHVNRVEMLFAEWNDLFEQSTSLGKIGSVRLKTHLIKLGLPENADLTKALFVLHTYHALVFKLLAAEIVLANTFLTGTRQEYCFAASTLNDDDLAISLELDVENSDLFRQVGILNFIEGSFFSWYLVKPSNDTISAIRELLRRITLYRLSELHLEKTRDIIKRVYQQLVPAPLRHNLGEFFTPEWLVEFTLNKCEYQGKKILVRKFLDPCCGSGNFLIHAIDRYKKQAKINKWDSEKTLNGILEHIFGFDLNPLAVLTARVNYLIAISDLIITHSDIEIPIYQADAVYAPTIAPSSSNSEVSRVYNISTRKQMIKLKLPEQLILKNRLFSRILEVMEKTIRQGDSEDIFLYSIRAEPSYKRYNESESWEPLLLDMFRKVENLERSEWNRIWCRIVRNYFASVAIGKCEYIASNPPWIRWSELPERYRERIKPTCDEYGIFSDDKFFGGNELDISGMITYTVADKWLHSNGGQLSFLITQTHFQSQSSGGFRKFRVKNTPLKIKRVDDFTQVRPFRGISNKPAVISLVKGEKTTYPIDYYVWSRKSQRSVPEDATLKQALQLIKCDVFEANSLSGKGHRWSILPPKRYSMLSVLDGKDPHIKGRKGILTDLNGAYFISLLGYGRIPGTVRFKNHPEKGKKDVPFRTDDIELDFVYPLIKGAGNIKSFFATTSPNYVIVPNKRITVKNIRIIKELAASHPKALKYFQAMNVDRLLEKRSTWHTRMEPMFKKAVESGRISSSDIPFYAIYNVGEYTFSS